MIGIGINKNVVLTKALINEKGTLELFFDELENLNKERNIFEESQSAEVTNDGGGAYRLMMFGLKKPSGTRNEGKTDDELLEMISGDISKVKNQLTQLVLQYVNKENVIWDPYYGTEVNGTNYRKLYLDNPTLESIFHNYAEQFIKIVEPFLGDKKYLLRVKLIRQSKDKNFPTIPGRFLEEQPWVDSMEIPDKATRVKMSQYEIEQGLDSAAAVTREDTDKKDVADTPEAKKSVFGQRS